MSEKLFYIPTHDLALRSEINKQAFTSEWMTVPNTTYDKDKYDTINTYHGLWTYAAVGDDFVLTDAGDSNNIRVMVEPKIVTFVETDLDNANVCRRSSAGSRYSMGQFVVDSKHVSPDGINPAISRFHSQLIQHEEQLKQYYKTINPKNLFFDIETTGLDPKEGALLSIGAGIDTEDVAMIDFRMLLDNAELDKVVRSQNPFRHGALMEAEKFMLKTFLESFQKADYDLMIGYFTWGFDIPFIVTRSLYHGLKKELLHLFRFPYLWNDPKIEFDHTNPALSKKIMEHFYYLADMTKGSPENKHFDFAGRIHLDILHHYVSKDQSVATGDKSMKGVGKHYKLDKDFPIFEEVDRKNMWLEYLHNLDDSRQYLTSDILLTRGEFMLYRPRSQLLLDNTPYGMYGTAIAKKTSGLAFEYGKEILKHGMIIAPNSPNSSPVQILIANKYEGAITGKVNIGWKHKVYKRDVISYYPNIMISFNLGLTNTIIEDVRPYTGQTEFHRNEGKEYATMWMPDLNNKVDYMLRIYKEKCPIVDNIQTKFQRRLSVKKRASVAYKDGDLVLNVMLDGEQQAIKIDINSSYGIAGNVEGMGCLPTAMAITTIARFFINPVMHITNMCNTYGEYSDVNEIDTDGVVFNRNVCIDSINEMVADLVVATGIAVSASIELEEENKGKAFVQKIKNYYMKDEDNGKVLIKGASNKNKNMSKVIQYIRDELFVKLQMGDDTNDMLLQHDFNLLAKNYISNPELAGYENYTKRVTNNKSLDGYGGENYIKKLGFQWEAANKQKCRIGTELKYVFVKEDVKHLLFNDINLEKLKNGDYNLDLQKYYEEYLSTQSIG